MEEQKNINKNELLRKVRVMSQEQLEVFLGIEENRYIFEFIRDNKDLMHEMIKENPNVYRALETVAKQIIQKNNFRRFGFRKAIERGEVKLEDITDSQKDELFELAREYETEQNYEEAKKCYKRIMDWGPGEIEKFYKSFPNYMKAEIARNTTYYQAKFHYYLCKLQNGEELSEEDRKDFKKLFEEDSDKIEELQRGFTYTDLFLTQFRHIKTVEELNTLTAEIDALQPLGHENGTSSGETADNVGKMSPGNRLKRFIEMFGIDTAKHKGELGIVVHHGEGDLSGYFVFELKGENEGVYLVEHFFDPVKSVDGTKLEGWYPSKDKATYILHRNLEFHFDEVNITSLNNLYKQFHRNTRLIDKAYHVKVDDEKTDEPTYYANLKRKVEEIARAGRENPTEVKSIGIEEIETISEIGVAKAFKQVFNEEEREETAEDKIETVEETEPIESNDTIDEAETMEEKKDDVEFEEKQESAEELQVNEDIENTETEIQENIEPIEEEKTPFQVHIDSLTAEIIELDERYQELTKRSDEFKQKISQYEQEIAELQNTLIDLTSDMISANLQQHISERIKTLVELQKAIKECEELLEQTRQEETKNREKRNELSKELREAIIRGE